MKFYVPYIDLVLSYDNNNGNKKIFETIEIIKRADSALTAKPRHITDSIAAGSAGGIHEFYSQADYAWPNPDTADGLPFVNRDGQSYPGAFFDHRKAMRSMRTNVSNFTAAYLLTKDKKYSQAACVWLKEFFLDDATYMEPSLLYSQAVSGVCTGRGIGIIDTLHLIDIPAAADHLYEAGVMEKSIYEGLQSWFAKYLNWMCTHKYGVDELNHPNNHSVCAHVQAAAFARFTGNSGVLKMCADHYKNILLPNQMADDGSFPLELARTKPYGYSIFVLDNMATLCFMLSTEHDNLWEFTLADGRSIGRGLDFLYPFLIDKSGFPYKPDVMYHNEWPVAMSFMLFAAAAYGDKKWLDLYAGLDKNPTVTEVRRNTAIRVPYLWLN
ncbi:MAG: alginate lyase family protein [Treponema sp.]|nr:alginate lyase family protein [Treponema sp.]